MVESLQEEIRLRAAQMEQLSQQVAEYMQKYDTSPSSSGASRGEDDS